MRPGPELRLIGAKHIAALNDDRAAGAHARSPHNQEPRSNRAEGLASASSNFPCHPSEVARG